MSKNYTTVRTKTEEAPVYRKKIRDTTYVVKVHFIVWVQKCETLNPGEVGIFVYEGNGYIKAYDEQEPAERCREGYTDSSGNVCRQPVLVSYNERYAPITVEPGAFFQIVGRFCKSPINRTRRPL